MPRVAGLVVVLAGLFGMHGLAPHGVTGMESMPLMPAVTATEASAVVSRVTASADAPHQTLNQVTIERVGDSHGSMNMNMTGLCVAILAIGLLGLLLHLTRRATPSLLWTSHRPFGHAPQAGRDPDPPSLTALSVQRC